MGAVVFGAVVSFGVAVFAMMVILREFAQRWSQIVEALAGEPARDAALATVRVRRPVARPMWPAPVRLQPSRRVAA